METALPFLTYGLPLAVVWGIFIYLRRKSEKRAMARLEESNAAGLNRPASLHPLIDPFLCLGCGACVRACPEGDILGLINGKAQLLEPSNCIGHGACATACPLDAITLVFGTAERGVEIPEVGPDFQTNVPGIYIAGELGGMGLIRNAIEQGRQAVGYIRDQRGRASGDQLDLVIVGAGPAGFAAALAAKEAGLNFTILEQESLGGTVAHFPRGKLVMTAPAELPIYGMAKFRETSKEDLLQFWQDVAAQTGLTISYEEQVEEIQPAGDGFTLRTTRGSYDTRSVLLAIGRRGTPRKLEVPGEDQAKVV
ncbi:NAD(P)-binding domain-containing protein, partial [Actibacterium sp.]|uniref:NAD(P)-binding domain-containing protein n=1 Tax=Actibacterium sp. TaxID=1872125 RepID=UPI0035670027